MIKSIQIKRNTHIYNSLDELYATIKDSSFFNTTLAGVKDGELLLFRYKNADGTTGSLLGEMYIDSSGKKSLHIEVTLQDLERYIDKVIKEKLGK
jgi:hypothetical protein